MALADKKTCKHEFLDEKRRLYGFVVYTRDLDGEIEDTHMEGSRVGPPPKTVVCPNCGKRLPNPRFNVSE